MKVDEPPNRDVARPQEPASIVRPSSAGSPGEEGRGEGGTQVLAASTGRNGIVRLGCGATRRGSERDHIARRGLALAHAGEGQMEQGEHVREWQD